MANNAQTPKDFRVAIVGGGMCGLLTAIRLSRANIEVEIYEAATSFREIGAGLGIGPNAVACLREMDVLDAVLEHIKPQIPELRPFRFVFGADVNEVIYDYPCRPEDSGLGVHRAVFLEALSHLFDQSHVHFSKRCIGLRVIQSGGSSPDIDMYSLNFSDGTSAEADVIIGADGIRSIIRTHIVEESQEADESLNVVRAAFTNTLAYRGLIPVTTLKEAGLKMLPNLVEHLHCIMGHGKHIITFPIPIKNDTLINVVAFSCDRSVEWGERPLPSGQPWVTQRSTAELLETYSDFSEDVKIFLRCLPNPSVWAIHGVWPPLESYSKGRVALIGDAAHAMHPHLGAGVGQGIEDAYALCRLLIHPSTKRSNVTDILQAYDSIRRRRAHSIHVKSTRAGDIYQGFGQSGDSVEGVKADLEGIWDEVWHYDLHGVVDSEISRLEASIFDQ